jgi:hypothetical protein
MQHARRDEKCVQYFGLRPLGTPGNRWEDNIRMDMREIG